jgi:cysteine synthase A
MMRLEFEPEGAAVFAKCEFLNPSGSIKDRLAKTVVDDAEKRGALNRDSIILECSSGNTGVAFAMLGAARGYGVTIVISEHASRVRRQLIEHFGAKVVCFPGENYWDGVELTRKMAAAEPRYFLPRQFENPLNPEDHEHATGREIIAQVPGAIDGLVAGYGTGGTLAGVGAALRRRYPAVQVHAMEPAEAALLLGETSCCHRIEGVADGFVPPLMRGVKLDGVVKITSAAATRMARRLAHEFGLLVGISSGANVAAALELGARLQASGGRNAPVVVTLLCDRAERYFSTALFKTAM